jgi:hypothetical protein
VVEVVLGVVVVVVGHAAVLSPMHWPAEQTSLVFVVPSVLFPTGPPVPLLPKQMLVVKLQAVPCGQHLPPTIVEGLPGELAPVPEHDPRPTPPASVSQSESLVQLLPLVGLPLVNLHVIGVSAVLDVVHARPSLQYVPSGTSDVGPET